jgi:hypothetical protein
LFLGSENWFFSVFLGFPSMRVILEGRIVREKPQKSNSRQVFGENFGFIAGVLILGRASLNLG